MEQCRQGKSAKWIRNFGKRIGSEGWARGSQSRTVGCRWTARAASAARAGRHVPAGGRTGNGSLGSLPRASNSRLRTAVCTLWPWHGQRVPLGLGIGKPCAHLALAWASHVHTLALARADFGLGRATLASEKKKKKVSRNLLKFCMEAYKLILSTSAKNGRKIRKNEVFSLVLRFRPWPCAHFGLGMGSRAHFGLGMGSSVHTLALA
ncbi:hypothetical protein LWI29_033648 [Acer saccharum]|uniref:Uncharacterized protein n=1 Tax=Acer saccharum TaxID=4024 RepID=A0AA39SM24_ACESA|nr:hypothetical protein LWI29_033648 [Acer saccharum]